MSRPGRWRTTLWNPRGSGAMRTYSTNPLVWSRGYEPAQRDAMPPSLGWMLFIVVWIGSCIGGFALVTTARQPVLGALLAGVPTVIGCLAKPTFALCCICFILPWGGAIAYEGIVSADRVVGGVAAVGILANCLFTGKGIRIKESPLLPLFLIAAWGAVSFSWAIYPVPAVAKALQVLQLSIWGLAIWNGLAYCGGHTWPLRCFVWGVLIVVLQLYLSGSIESMTHSAERVTVGEGVNPGKFAVILGSAFFVSVYLFLNDPSKWLRPVWIAAAIVTPGVMVQTGSRGPMVGLAIATAVSVLSFRMFWKSKTMAIATILMLILFAGGVYWSFHGGFVSKLSVTRLTSSTEGARSVSYRFYLVKTGIGYILAHPLTGAGLENYLLHVGQQNIVHVDIIHLGTELGIPAMLLYIWFLIKQTTGFTKTTSPPQKWLMRTFVIFLAISACGHVLFFKKVFWFFMVGSAAIAYRSRHLERYHVAEQ